jgi:flagellar biosynthesis/type III secretory pathway protein FliH
MEFLFEKDFDVQIAEEKEAKKNLERSPLIYSEDDLKKRIDEVRNEALEEGYNQGFKEGMLEKENEIINTANKNLKMIEPKLDQIIEYKDEFESNLEEKALTFCSSIFEKILPSLIYETYGEKINEILYENYKSSLSSDWIQLTLNPEIKEEVSINFERILEKENYHGKFTIIEDQNLEYSSLTLSWESGNLNIELEKIYNQIIELVKQRRNKAGDKDE